MYKKFTKICESCNIEYLGDKNRKYCSYKCAKKSREKKIILNCENCKKEFTIQDYRKNESKFCSRKCKHEYHSSEIIEIECTGCGKLFSKKSHKIGNNNFCTHKCHVIYNKGENHYEYKPNLHDKTIKLALKQWAQLIKFRDNFKCMKCGNEDKLILEAHHIKSRSNFPNLQFEIDNGITLCCYCHLKEHFNDEKASRLIKYKIKKYEKKICMGNRARA